MTEKQIYLKYAESYNLKLEGYIHEWFRSCYYTREIEKRIVKLVIEYFRIFDFTISKNFAFKDLYTFRLSKRSFKKALNASHYFRCTFDYTYIPSMVRLDKHGNCFELGWYERGEGGELKYNKNGKCLLVWNINPLYEEIKPTAEQRVKLGKSWLEQQFVKGMVGLNEDVKGVVIGFL